MPRHRGRRRARHPVWGRPGARCGPGPRGSVPGADRGVQARRRHCRGDGLGPSREDAPLPARHHPMPAWCASPHRRSVMLGYGSSPMVTGCSPSSDSGLPLWRVSPLNHHAVLAGGHLVLEIEEEGQGLVAGRQEEPRCLHVEVRVVRRPCRGVVPSGRFLRVAGERENQRRSRIIFRYQRPCVPEEQGIISGVGQRELEDAVGAQCRVQELNLNTRWLTTDNGWRRCGRSLGRARTGTGSGRTTDWFRVSRSSGSLALRHDLAKPWVREATGCQ